MRVREGRGAEEEGWRERVKSWGRGCGGRGAGEGCCRRFWLARAKEDGGCCGVGCWRVQFWRRWVVALEA